MGYKDFKLKAIKKYVRYQPAKRIRMVDLLFPFGINYFYNLMKQITVIRKRIFTANTLSITVR